jgi:WD40 repeat protein
VFISYARKDGEAFATALRTTLSAQGIAVWQDRVGMEGGRDWWLQITDVLDKVDFMVLIMTPRAVESEIVRKEWRYARQNGVCVYPVIAAPNLDFNQLPQWMRKVHFYNLGLDTSAFQAGPNWVKFVADLRGSCNAPRVPFMAEDLPNDFIVRPEKIDGALGHLLDAKRENPLALTAALRGAGGYGKTTIAKAICHHPAVQEAFSDGILWVTLGENNSEADLIGKLNDLIYTLRRERSGAVGLDNVSKEFADLLAERSFLLVIDDVWNSQHLRPFLQGGKNCTRLITTRRDDTLPAATSKIDIDAMKNAEAAELLATNLPKVDRNHLAEPEKNALKALADRLGEWPLLLKLSNGILRAQIELGQTLAEALTYANQALDEEGFDALSTQDSDSRHSAASKSISASMRLLSEAETIRLAELAIFPEDVDLPLATVEKLWAATGQMSAYGADKLWKRLKSLSLLLSLSLETRTLRLHDVIRTYLARKHKEELSQWQGAFLASYNLLQWEELPTTEPYLWDYLFYHLREAGQTEAIKSTLLRYPYLKAKLSRRDVNALLADLDQLPADADVGLLWQAVSIGANVLLHDKGQLPLQLTGRLRGQQGQPAFAALLESASQDISGPLQPLTTAYKNQAGGNLLRTLAGHRGSVGGALELRDGRLLSWAADLTPLLWSAEGELLATLDGHTKQVGSALELRDGRLLSWAEDNTLRLWTAKGKLLAVLEGHQSSVVGSCELSDGRLLSWAEDHTLRLWAASGEALAVLEGHQSSVVGVCELSDRRLLSWGKDRNLHLWGASGESLAVLEGHTDDVNGALALNDGRLLSWSRDNTLRLWSAAGELLAVLEGHTHSVRGASELRDGRLLSWAKDNTLRLWSAMGKALAVLEEHEGGVRGALVLKDGRLLSWAADNTLRLWSGAGEILKLLTGHTNIILGARELSDGRLLSWGGDWTLRLWTAAGDLLTTLSGHTHSVRGASELRDGRLLSCGADRTLRLWRAAGKAEAVTDTEKSMGEAAGLLTLSDGRLLSWGWNTLCLWAASGELLAVLEGHTSGISGALELRDGRLISWGKDMSLHLWAANGEWQTVLRGHTGEVRGALELRDGRLISWAKHDTALRLWSANGVPMTAISGHMGSADGVLELRDGRLISWIKNDTLHLWSATGKMLASSKHRPDLLPTFLISHRVTETLPNLLRGQERRAYTDTGHEVAWDTNNIRLYKVGVGNALANFHADSLIVAAAFFAGGQKLAVVCEDGLLIFFTIAG